MQTKQYFKLTKNVLSAVLILGFLFTIHNGQNISTAYAAGTIRYAAPGGAASGACNSWGNACELRYVLTSVAVPGDQIWVKAGTYKPTAGTDRSISFVLTNGVALYGGFNGTETQLSQRNPASNITILSGEIGSAGITDNSYHVVIGSGTNNTAVLDGFTITQGNAANDKGGGMWNYSGNPILRNLIFNENSASQGGGICNEISSSPSLSNVTFGNNFAEDGGGGMYNSSNSNPILTDVSFNNNETGGLYKEDGGGMYNDNSSPTLTNVTFSENSAENGGGMFNTNSDPYLASVNFSGNTGFEGGGISNLNSNPNLSNVTFTNNYASDGGGMYNRYSNPTLTNVMFSGNSVEWDGGGMENITSSPTLNTVTFSDNTADSMGGGMYNDGQSFPVLEHVAFTNNHATFWGGGLYDVYMSVPIINNSIFSGNTATSGGGMYLSASSYLSSKDPFLANVTFSNNSATKDGGGMYFSNDDNLLLQNITFIDNSAVNGGGIYIRGNSNPSLANVTLSRNNADYGGGIYNEGSAPVLHNFTFSGNTAAISAGGMYNTESNPSIHNSIFWNDGSEIYNNYSTPIIADSIISGGCPSSSTCTHVINSNPLLGPLQDNGGFTQTMALGAGSPAIDAGNDLTCVTTDQRGIDRPQGSHCDIGAYEYAPNAKNFQVEVGNTQQGSYWLSPSQSKRIKYSGLNNGPARVESLSGSPLVASQRVLYGGRSYSEMMGLPFEQLSKEYLFPYYNNVAMDSQLRVSNVGGSDTTIKVYLGADPTPIDSYTLAAGGATRKNYPFNSGPLRVTSSASNILATIRVLYAGSSYSELMGLPVEQLSKEYLFPYYNNVAMDSQLRVSNVGGADTTITVYLGTQQIDSYTLAAGGASRKNYTGKNSGPLRVTSTDSNILATIRVLYAGSSLSELMGFPVGQLSQSYWYPVYDNMTLDSQLRVSNVGGDITTITVYAGTEQIDSYELGKGAASRKNYPRNTGPLHVVSSTQPILTTVRLLYGSSLYEMTGLPNEQLSTQYFFPWYNNYAMNSELRFAVP
jgi:predicted outer membrane repeat protein